MLWLLKQRYNLKAIHFAGGRWHVAGGREQGAVLSELKQF